MSTTIQITVEAATDGEPQVTIETEDGATRAIPAGKVAGVAASLDEAAGEPGTGAALVAPIVAWHEERLAELQAIAGTEGKPKARRKPRKPAAKTGEAAEASATDEAPKETEQVKETPKPAPPKPSPAPAKLASVPDDGNGATRAADLEAMINPGAQPDPVPVPEDEVPPEDEF